MIYRYMYEENFVLLDLLKHCLGKVNNVFIGVKYFHI